MSDFRSTRESNTSEHSLANPMQYHYSFTGGYRSTLALFLGTLYMLPASWRSNNVARRIPCNSSSKSRDRRTKVTSHKAEIGKSGANWRAVREFVDISAVISTPKYALNY